MFKTPVRPAVKKPPAETEVVGQQKKSNNGVGHKAPFVSAVVGKM